MGGMLRAQQVPMAIPNGSFEQWTSHSGYSVSVLILSIPVYDTFSTPSLWNYPSYPVNQTVNFMGMNVNLNTNVPIVKTTRETGVVPDSNTAVRLQTIMLSDIVNSTVLNLASGSIDTMLTQEIIPSILSTGEVDVEAFLPLVSNLMSGSGDLVSMLPTLLALDVNDYITGGLALGDFRPGRLTGSYKYQSAVAGDNGGVLMIGTHYNAATHRRDIVGAGLNVTLFDAGVYTPFGVDYMPASDLVPGSPRLEPDSLIVLLFSSAGNNRQQGSYLCVDNLMLWPAPDTCATVVDMELSNVVFDAFPEMVLEWYGSYQPDHWEVEYGPYGFQHGTGTLVETDEPYFEIYELENAGVLRPNTWYDFYVRSVCDDSVYGDWELMNYQTFCARVNSLTVHGSGEDLHVTADHRISGYSVTWVDATDTRRWGVSYGVYNPEYPDILPTYREVDTPYFELPPLVPGRQYTVSVAAHCAEDNYGDDVWTYVNTPDLEGINGIGLTQLSIQPNPANGQCQVTLPDNTAAELRLYTVDGRLLQTVKASSSAVLELSMPGVYLLHATTSTGVATYKIVNQ